MAYVIRTEGLIIQNFETENEAIFDTYEEAVQALNMFEKCLPYDVKLEIVEV